MADPFERDFGYLMPFLDKVQAAAEKLAPDARAELRTLIAEEKQRWPRIRALLGGAAAPRANAATRAEPMPAAFSLTVGSLRNLGRK